MCCFFESILSVGFILCIFTPMKKTILAYSITAILLASCQGNSSNSFSINGKADFEDGKKIYLVKANENNQPIVVDSTQVFNGTFKFNGVLDQIDLNFLTFENENRNLVFVLENGTIDVTIFKDSIGVSKIGGTISNLDLIRYRDDSDIMARSLTELVTKIQRANAEGDDSLSKELQNQYFDLQKKMIEFEKTFINTNTDSFVSSLILERFIAQKAIPLNEIRSIFSKFSERIKKSSSGVRVSEVVNAPIKPTEIGEIAPLFEGLNPYGERIALEQFRGKITIIDFWAAWCRPCRVENPNLVRLYRRFHDKGLEIIGVSLDKDRESWLQAIKDDGLVWNHVSSLKFWQDPIAELYQIRSIPAAFILDREGRIVARDLRGAQLESKVEELLEN